MSRRAVITGLLIGLIALLTSACDAATEDTTTTSDETTTTEQADTTTTEDTTTTTADTTTTTTADATTTSAAATGEFDDEAFQTDDFPATGETVFLEQVDVEAHEGFDRVVFHFADSATASDLSYQIQPVTEGEFDSPGDTPLEIDGDFYYQVTLAPASGVDLSGEAPVETYLGPDSFVPETPANTVQELAISEDFEGQMSWVIGLDSDTGFAHTLNADDGQLIVDFES